MLLSLIGHLSPRLSPEAESRPEFVAAFLFLNHEGDNSTGESASSARGMYLLYGVACIYCSLASPLFIRSMQG